MKYRVSFFNLSGYEGTLIISASSADETEALGTEAAEFYGFFFCPDLTAVAPFKGAEVIEGITAHFLDYEEACRELESACGFDCMGDAEVTLK